MSSVGVIRVRRRYAAPMDDGLVDIHCHGAVGATFGSDTEDSRRAAAHHRAAGSTGLVASLVSGSAARMTAEALALAPLVADGTVLGLHLEGPFLAPSCRGAHDVRALRDPDPGFIERLAAALADAGAAGAIRQVTFAPELPGAYGLIRTLAEHRIVPALGHTAASAEQLRDAVDTVLEVCGVRPVVTHVFNGMPAFHHRAGGPAAAALSASARGEAFLEVIADGVHLAPEVVRLVFDAVGAEQVVLVSDATAATGLGDGGHRLGGLDVVVAGGTARLRRTDGRPGAIAGSTRTLADCVRWAVDVAGIAEADALTAATRTPLRALGV